MKEIRTVAVLGSGTMGTGIAGVCANAGCEVLLLDMDQAACDKAKQNLTAGRSPIVKDEALLANIKTGSFENDLAAIADADWICEAIIENVDIKRSMFGKIEPIRKDGSILTTNTSGIPLKDIYQGMPERMQQDIAVTHFFNPVHIMKLVELVPGENTRPEVIETLGHFLGTTLKKGVVYAKDTVNFIGNRIGCFWMLTGMNLAEKAMKNDGLTIETVDALMSTPVGFPATGLYGLIDLIGLDVMYNVGKNLDINLPADDYGRKFTALTDNVQKLHDQGQLGRKTGGGFYKLTRHDDGSKTMEVFDITHHHWRDAKPHTLSDSEQSINALFSNDEPNGRFMQDIMATTLCYTADLVPDISIDIVNVDRAMRWGFGWKKGPFELIDELGAKTLIDLVNSEGMGMPKMLQVMIDADESTFYRKNGEEHLGTDGNWHTVSA
ncbi:MAG: hypothetical protein GKR96_06255 [Gammaproteobacteria bacterium]|nr:hypothetical protein [Gammaproteobacteria bacterium]